MLQYLKETMGHDIKNAIIVSPDAGGAKRASSMAAALDLDFALFHKERKKANQISRMVLVGNVEGKVAILVDDMADTCGTLALAATHLLAGGATSVLALVTHGILSGPALKVLAESAITKLIVTNSIPQSRHLANGSKVREIDVSHVLAEAVRRSHFGESVSFLFHSIPWTEVRRPCRLHVPATHVLSRPSASTTHKPRRRPRLPALKISSTPSHERVSIEEVKLRSCTTSLSEAVNHSFRITRCELLGQKERILRQALQTWCRQSPLGSTLQRVLRVLQLPQGSCRGSEVASQRGWTYDSVLVIVSFSTISTPFWG